MKSLVMNICATLNTLLNSVKPVDFHNAQRGWISQPMFKEKFKK